RVERLRQRSSEHRPQAGRQLRQRRVEPHAELVGIGGHAVYPPTPMAVRQPDTLSREHASELVRAWAGGRPGPLGSVLGRQTAVDQVGVELRVETLKKRSIKKASKLLALDLA